MALETKKNGNVAAPPKALTIDAAARAAALAGGDTSEWRETAQVFLYKPEHFVATRENGVEACWEMKDGKKVPTAPAIVGIPYATILRTPKDGGDPYYQVAIELTKPTFVMAGEGAAKYEVLVPKGLTVLMTMTAGLDRLDTLANHPSEATEVEVRAIQKESIGNNKSMWRFTIKENPVKRARVVAGAAPQLPLPAELS